MVNAMLTEFYRQVRQRSLTLIQGLSAEDTQLQSMPDASPLKWHLAHTSWFFETFVLLAHDPDYQAFDPTFNYLYNSYYNAAGKRHPRAHRGMVSRPSLERIRDYRAHIDDAMLRILPSIDTQIEDIVQVGLHHEMQHQELMVTDFKHALWLNRYALTQIAAGLATPLDEAVSSLNNWRDYDGGLVLIGHDASQGYGYDIESPEHQYYLQPFALARSPVTNADFLRFIDDGGYQNPDFWMSEGFELSQQQQWQSPLYWCMRQYLQSSDPNDIQLMTWGGYRRIDLNEPVTHISWYEADAFARWAGARLPTEFEWEHAARQQAVSGHFLEDKLYHPRAIATHAAKTDQLQQLFGDVWEWTQSSYAPYPGFQPAPGALSEYNGKFMINQMVLRGGSCASAQAHIRATYRNFFHPHQRWQFSGLRLAQDR